MTTAATRRPVRVGNCSGFYGDRIMALREQVTGGDLDVVTGDYLAELTMLILGRDRRREPSLGYARTFLRQLESSLGEALDRGVRIVVNAGGLAPGALADEVRGLADRLGLSPRVAHVEGDDVLDMAAQLGHPDALTANAYLGGRGITHALTAGADVVVTGRVTDAALVTGAAAWWHGWAPDDHDALAGALAAGHVIECGCQATGGNLAGASVAPGAVDRLLRPGFPIAEVAADGSCVVTKHEGTGGVVDADTVTAQLLYEVAGPRYANPDVVLRLDHLRVTQDGPDRVAVTGATGEPPPPTLKVAVNVLGGHHNTIEFLLTGLDVESKAALVRAQVTRALADDPPVSVAWTLARTDAPDAPTQEQASARLRCSVRDPDPERVGRRFSGACVELALASYAGFAVSAPPSSASPYGVFHAATVDAGEVEHRVVLPDGAVEVVGHPTTTAPLRPVAPPDPPAPWPADAPSRRAPLGDVARARSGDKGGDANVGVWVATDEAYRWLVGVLTADGVRALLPEVVDLAVDVHPLPGLRAVNLVVHGLLGEGVASSDRFDPQAKGLGEWLRSRHLDVPVALLEDATVRVRPGHDRRPAVNLVTTEDVPDPLASEERRALRALATRFVTDEVVDHHAAWEDDGRLPRQLHRAAAAVGLLGLGFPEEVGGSGGTLLDVLVRDEAMMEAGASSGLMSALFTLAISCPHIVQQGTPAQVDRWVRPVLAGEAISSLAITEPGAGSDVNHITTRARRDGDHLVVDGAKTYITSGIRADHLVVAVRTGGEGAAGISLVVVPADVEGLTVTGPLRKTGWWCSDTAELVLEDVHVPVENLIGEEGSGFAAIGRNFVGERIGMAVQGYSTARRALELTVAWCRERETFGRPLLSRQVVRHTLVGMRTRVEAARALTRQVALRAVAGEDVVAEACMAKNLAADCAERVCRDAVQLHGGLGFMVGPEVERLHRDAKILAIGGGASEVLADLAAKRLGYG